MVMSASVDTTLRIQHISNLTEERRRLRFSKYEEADPKREFQSGYDHGRRTSLTMPRSSRAGPPAGTTHRPGTAPTCASCSPRWTGFPRTCARARTPLSTWR